MKPDTRDWGPAFGYTVATGKLWCPMAEFQRHAEALLGRPIFTHEFGGEGIWVEMRETIERQEQGVGKETP